MNGTLRRRNARHYVWLVARLLATAGVLTWAITQLDLAALRQLLTHVALLPLLFALLLQFAGVWLSAWKWWFILRSNSSQVRYLWLVRVYFVGQFVSLVLPTGVGGDAVRGWMLARHGLPPATAAASILAERFTGFVALTALAVLAWVANAQVLATAPDVFVAATAVVLGATTMIAAAVTASRWSPWVAQLPIPDLGGWRRHLGDVGAVLLGLAARPRAVLVVMATSLVFQLSSITVTYGVIRALGLPVSWTYAALLAPLADIVSLLPVVVGDWGSRLVTYAVLLKPLAIAPSAAVGLALLVSLVRAVVGSAGAAVALWDWRAEPERVRAALGRPTRPTHNQGHAE